MSRNSPLKYGRLRSRSRERFRRSPIRHRLSIHARLDDKRSIERRLAYPSKYELNERTNRSRVSKSPPFSSSRSSKRRSRSRTPRRRRSSSRSSRRSGRSRSPRRSRIYSRSRSREREERTKFTFASDYNITPLDLVQDDLSRNLSSFNCEPLVSSNYLQPMLDKPLIDKMPFDHRPFFLPEHEFYQIPNQNLNDSFNHSHFKINQFVNNNDIIPQIPERSSIRDRLDVPYSSASTSNVLLDTPTNFNPNVNSFQNQLNSPASNNLNNMNMNNLNNPNTLNLNTPISNNLNNNNLNNQDNGYFNQLINRNDVDLRSQNSSLLGNGLNQQAKSIQMNQEQSLMPEKCSFSYLGCPISLTKDMAKHQDECLYNPKNVTVSCTKCKLIVCPEHDCIQELRNELNSTKMKTAWSVNATKLALFTEISGDHQLIAVHYSGEREIMKKFKINRSNRMDLILKQAVELVFTKESLIRQNKTERDFQLICPGVYTFQPEITFQQSTRLQLPTQNDDLHLILIDKKITLKVLVKRLFYENQQIIVSLPSSIPFIIDPTKRILDLKEMISEKLPIKWSKHRLLVNGKEFKDFQILYAVGIVDGDRVEVEAF